MAVSDDDKPVDNSDNGESPDGAGDSPSSNPPQGPPRFWGSPTPSEPVDPSDFGASSSGGEEESVDTTPSWIQQQQTPPQESPSYPPPPQQTPPQQPPAQPGWGGTPPAQPNPGYEQTGYGSQQTYGQQPGYGQDASQQHAGWGATPPPGPQQPGNQFGDIPTFQPPSASGGGQGRTFDLRPYTVADILDITFQLMKSNWKALAILTLVFALPDGIVSAISNAASHPESQGFSFGSSGSFSYLSNFSNDESASGAALAVSLIAALFSLLISLLLQPLVQGAIVRLVAANFVGRDMTPREAFDGVKGMWLTFVGASIMVTLAILGGLIGLIIGALVVAVLFTAVVPIIAIEEEGVFNAMGRSWALMKRGFWRYLGARVAFWFITSMVSAAVVAVPLFVAYLFYGAGLTPLGAIFAAIGSVLSSVVAFPIGAIAATLIYFDARVRFEGFDVQLMAARLPQASAPQQQTPPNYGPGPV